jgi:hypothetical protein
LSSPFHLITVLNAGATAFNQEHNDGKNYTTSATDHAEDFILWTWGVGAGQVTAKKIIFDPTNSNLEHFKIKQHQACINPLGRVTWAAIPDSFPPFPAVDPSNMAVHGLLEILISHQADKQ